MSTVCASASDSPWAEVTIGRSGSSLVRWRRESESSPDTRTRGPSIREYWAGEHNRRRRGGFAENKEHEREDHPGRALQWSDLETRSTALVQPRGARTHHAEDRNLGGVSKVKTSTKTGK
jgi:hypothetical protein